MIEPFEIVNGYGVHRIPFNVPRKKQDLIFRLMRVLTNYYRVPHLFPKWAMDCAKRESLGSTGIGKGFAILHQFQNNGRVQLNNYPVDWWLVISPEGIEWNALDEKPVFGMIGHIFPPNHRYLPLLKLRTWALTESVAHRIEAHVWKRIARMDRITAAKEVNKKILLPYTI
jgi:mannitol/fructose-specific phosphotransferase system IIA component (Ntr-type)